MLVNAPEHTRLHHQLLFHGAMLNPKLSQHLQNQDS